MGGCRSGAGAADLEDDYVWVPWDCRLVDLTLDHIRSCMPVAPSGPACPSGPPFLSPPQVLPAPQVLHSCRPLRSCLPVLHARRPLRSIPFAWPPHIRLACMPFACLTLLAAPCLECGSTFAAPCLECATTFLAYHHPADADRGVQARRLEGADCWKLPAAHSLLRLGPVRCLSLHNNSLIGPFLIPCISYPASPLSFSIPTSSPDTFYLLAASSPDVRLPVRLSAHL